MIDLRSDTVTRPTEAMRRAMSAAEVGDDVLGEDPTVNRLEAMAAERCGMEAAVFVPSGTQGNLAAMLAHCARGEEVILGHDAHTYRNEGGGIAVLGGVQPQVLPMDAHGRMDPEAIAGAIKPDDPHHAVTRLLAQENTHHGTSVPRDYLAAAAALANQHGLGHHLDGARLFNAAVAEGVAPAEILRHFDSVSICLSKGLGAPVGSLVCGSAALMKSVRRWRKVLGGGMRQAGVLAAAGLHALKHHVERLAEDHERARELAATLESLPGLEVRYTGTNMLFVTPPEDRLDAVVEALSAEGVRVTPAATLRLVTHLDVPDEVVERVRRGFEQGLNRGAA